jgi:hypothetical protein
VQSGQKQGQFCQQEEIKGSTEEELSLQKVCIDSNDADLDSLGENDEDGGDQADAYEKLWLERKKDRLVPYK